MGAPTKTDIVVYEGEAQTLDVKAFGGGLEGADRTQRETVHWTPSMASPDQQINIGKQLMDARGRDMATNDGYINGAVSQIRDNIAGPLYRLNAMPDWEFLGANQTWARDFKKAVESRFALVAESDACWLDAGRRMTLTGMIRLAMATHGYTGEVTATAEWIKDRKRPCYTAIQMFSPDRLQNPDGMLDTQFLRRGVEVNSYGQPIAYHILNSHPGEIFYNDDSYTWKRVPAELSWGRKQVIHIYEPLQISQSRGVSDMVAVLKQMRMTKKFQDLTLQKAVVAASYIASMESDLPPSEVFTAMGQGNKTYQDVLGEMMGSAATYFAAGNNTQIDGVKIPLLFPGTKINAQPLGQDAVDIKFEQSLLRHIAASLGISYEELSRDYTNTNYSSARASMAQTWKAMKAKKRQIADKFATAVYVLWLEEEINDGTLPLPRGRSRDDFYKPLFKEAYSKCKWIGAPRGQVDQLKETQAAMLKIQGGLSTYEDECAELGSDWQEVMLQRAREKAFMTELGLDFDTDPTKSILSSSNSDPADKTPANSRGKEDTGTENE